jgi:hypothetical protein
VKLPKVSDDVVVQLFVTDSAGKFDGESATTPHELVCLLRGGARRSRCRTAASNRARRA